VSGTENTAVSNGATDGASDIVGARVGVMAVGRIVAGGVIGTGIELGAIDLDGLFEIGKVGGDEGVLVGDNERGRAVGNGDGRAENAVVGGEVGELVAGTLDGKKVGSEEGVSVGSSAVLPALPEEGISSQLGKAFL